MSICPNSKVACECQPQDGVMCPHGPTPNDWRPWGTPAPESPCAGKATQPVPGEQSSIWCYRCGEGTIPGLCRAPKDGVTVPRHETVSQKTPTE